MVAVVDLAKLVGRGAHEDTVDVSVVNAVSLFELFLTWGESPQDEQELALSRPLLDALAAREDAPQPPVNAHRHEHARRQADESAFGQSEFPARIVDVPKE